MADEIKLTLNPFGSEDAEVQAAAEDAAQAATQALAEVEAVADRFYDHFGELVAETDAEKAKNDLLDLLESQKTGRILAGTIQGVEGQSSDPSRTLAVIYHGEYKILIVKINALTASHGLQGQHNLVGLLVEIHFGKNVSAEAGELERQFICRRRNVMRKISGEITGLSPAQAKDVAGGRENYAVTIFKSKPLINDSPSHFRSPLFQGKDRWKKSLHIVDSTG